MSASVTVSRQIRAVSALLITVQILSACSLGGAEPKPEGTVAGKTAAELTEAELAPALLAPDGLPAGFIPFNRPRTPERKSDGGRLPPDVCRASFSSRARAFANADFTNSAGSVVLGEVVSAYDPGKASEYLAEVATASRSCSTYRDPVTGVDAQVVPSPFPPVGDESVAFRLTTTQAGGFVTSERVYIRSGDFVVRIVQLAPVVDRALTLEIVRRALDKLARAR